MAGVASRLLFATLSLGDEAGLSESPHPEPCSHPAHPLLRAVPPCAGQLWVASAVTPTTEITGGGV